MTLKNFKERLNELGYRSYAEYLSSDYWADFRDKFFSSGASRTCRVCDGWDVDLHHMTYKTLGRESFSDVLPLCKKHHGAVHMWLQGKGVNVGFTMDAVLSITRAGTSTPYVPSWLVKGPKEKRSRPRKPSKEKRKLNKLRKAARRLIETLALPRTGDGEAADLYQCLDHVAREEWVRGDKLLRDYFWIKGNLPALWERCGRVFFVRRYTLNHVAKKKVKKVRKRRKIPPRPE